MWARGAARDALFGAASRSDPRALGARALRLVAFLALLAVVATLLAARRPEGLTIPRFYAEDGAVFFRDAYQLPAWRSLFLPHAGYQNLAVRALAEAAWVLAPQHHPLFYNGAALLVAALSLGWIALPGFRHWIASDALRAGLALWLVVLPNQEALMKLSYLQWYLLLWLSLTSLMRWPRSRALGNLLAAACAVALWTTPLGVITLPLFALRAWGADADERRQAIAVVLAGVAALVVNVASPYTSPHPVAESSAGAGVWLAGLAKGLVYKLSAAFLGDARLYGWYTGGGWTAVFAASAAGLAVLLVCAAAAGRRAWLLAAVVAGLAVASVLPTGLRAAHLVELADGTGLRSHGRYFLVASCLCVLAAAGLAARVARRLPARAPTALAVLALAAALALHWPDRRLPSYTPYEDGWREAVRDLAELEAQVNAAGRPATLEIGINPSPWKIVLRVEPDAGSGGH